MYEHISISSLLAVTSLALLLTVERAAAYDPLTIGKIFYVNPNGTKYFKYDLEPRTTYYVSPREWAAFIEKPDLLPGDGSFAKCTQPKARCTDLDGKDPVFEENIYKLRSR